ncbi:proteasome subunit alpha type- hypothetical protein [Limosa lapponica baueri]|uniref:Proteasome subunit alpha type-7 n=1 Tax=Limosa lapponica baueri TaxID=1758121 RepID=A0A2I0T0P3_LIMLA|nr:proteasome subunit alpha type- hypothetical protein [Limosa lapponica baueri]
MGPGFFQWCPGTGQEANAIGRGAKSVREFLEKNYTDEAIETDDLTIKLVIKALLEVVQSGGKNIELAVMRREQPLKECRCVCTRCLGLGKLQSHFVSELVVSVSGGVTCVSVSDPKP